MRSIVTKQKIIRRNREQWHRFTNIMIPFALWFPLSLRSYSFLNFFRCHKHRVWFAFILLAHISKQKTTILWHELSEYMQSHRPQAIEGISRDVCVISVSYFRPVLIRGQPPSTFVWARRKNLFRKQWSMDGYLIYVLAEHGLHACSTLLRFGCRVQSAQSFSFLPFSKLELISISLEPEKKNLFSFTFSISVCFSRENERKQGKATEFEWKQEEFLFIFDNSDVFNLRILFETSIGCYW